MRGRPLITHKKNDYREPITNGFTVCVLQHYQPSVKSYSMGNVRQVVPSISSAVRAIEARDGNDSQLGESLDYKKYFEGRDERIRRRNLPNSTATSSSKRKTKDKS